MTRHEPHIGTAMAVMGILLAACGVQRSASTSAGQSTCTRCHGDASRTPAAIAPAPPLDTRGNSATTAPGVGAHQSHLLGGSIRAGIPCTECHVLPTDLAHAGQPLQLTWGSLAKTDGVNPAFDASSLTCSNYCHGATTPGGTNKTPTWNVVDGSQIACGTCHGVPPPSPHPAVGGLTTCAGCHAGTVNADGTINTSGGLHIDGKVELAGGSASCTGCHGDASRTPAAIAPAPPLDTRGNSATTAPGVGAHESHLLGGSIRAGIPCTECHVLPTDLAHAGQPLQLTWGSLAKTDGVNPAFDASSLTCSNYCHGATTPGGTNKTPTWNVVDGSQIACGTCHGVPPPSPHPRYTINQCYYCHRATVNSDGTINVSGGKHINGSVDVWGG